MECQILGSCSGLLLLFIDDGLCVVNPLTKKFRFLNQCRLLSCARAFSLFREVVRSDTKHLGFAVNRTTQSFKIVHILEDENPGETRYWFEINAGNSWRYSKTTITCCSSDLDNRMENHVYRDGSLHWLRNDGSIVAFNPETEQARLIPTKFPEGLSLKTLLAAGDSSLTLISATEEVIYVYALENILSDPKWMLVTQIRNIVLDENWLVYWNVEAYDRKCLVLREDKDRDNRVVHVYDLSPNKWVVTSSIPGWCDTNLDLFQFTPSWSSVEGLDEILACDDKRISSLSSIMGLINGISSEKVEKQLRKQSVEEGEKRN